MRIATYRKTTPPTMNSTSPTEQPEVGSDEYMMSEGYRAPTESERKQVGGFLRHLTLISVFAGWFRRRDAR